MMKLRRYGGDETMQGISDRRRHERAKKRRMVRTKHAPVDVPKMRKISG